jgi:hypothetical protein
MAEAALAVLPSFPAVLMFPSHAVRNGQRITLRRSELTHEFWAKILWGKHLHIYTGIYPFICAFFRKLWRSVFLFSWTRAVFFFELRRHRPYVKTWNGTRATCFCYIGEQQLPETNYFQASSFSVPAQNPNQRYNSLSQITSTYKLEVILKLIKNTAWTRETSYITFF